MTRDETANRCVPYRSFLVRFWGGKDANGAPTIIAEVYSVQDGDARSFEGVEAALDYLRRHTQELLAPNGSQPRRSSLHPSEPET